MSLPENNNSYDVADIEGIESVRYDGQDMSLNEAFNTLLQPQYDLIEEEEGMQRRDDLISYDTFGDDFIDSKKEEMEKNWEKEFQVTLDTVDGLKEFYLQRNNDQRPEVQEHPYSTGMLESEDGEKLGLRMMRNHRQDNEQGLVHERDFLTAVEKPGGLNEKLRERGLNPIGRSNFIIAEDTEGSSPASYNGSEQETTIFYNYADTLAERLDEKAREFGEYIGTVSELGLGRMDRNMEEFMVADDGHVYETDHEKLVLSENAGVPRDDLVDLITKISSSSDMVDDPREIQSEVMEGYNSVVEGDYELEGLVEESMEEWDLSNFEQEHLL